MRVVGVDEHEPVDDSEYLLRRIHKKDVQVAATIRFPRGSFVPNRHDTNGLSFYRERFISPANLADAGAKRGEYFVVRIAAAAMRALGLTLSPSPDPAQPPGHVLVPELRLERYRTDKANMTLIQIELMKLATNGIVVRPSL